MFAIAVVTLVCAGIMRSTPWEGEEVAQATIEPYATIIPSIVPEVPMQSPEVEELDSVDKNSVETSKNHKKSEKAKAVNDSKNAKAKLSFDAKKGLEWPVVGTVVKEYSGDKPVYFQTLKQYKVNPAILIESAEGTNVKASADGQVTMVTETDETGTTVTIYHGDDYTTVYGQLKNVTVKKGDLVTTGLVIGKVSKPTATYKEEGNHLYFQMKKKGEAINPNQFIKE